MRDGRRGRPRRVAPLSVVVLATVGLVLSACSSGGGGGAGGGGDSVLGGNAPTTTTKPQPVVSIAVTPASAKAINPSTPIVIKASRGKLTDVSITNTSRGTHVSGRFSADHTSWKSNEVMGYGQTYSVVAGGVDDHGMTVQHKSTLTTINPAKKAFPNMVPAPSSVAETGVGVGQPIVFRFSEPVENKAEVQQHLQVTTDPPQPGAWYWIDDKNVHYRSKDFWQPGTTIRVTAKIYGLDFGNGVYGAEDRTETFHVHDSWIAKADGDTEQMVIYHNGHAVNKMPISMGKDSTPTHRGTHVVSFKKADYIMDSCTYGVCKGDPHYYRSHEKWSVRISNDGEFVHENPNSVAEQGSSNVSHGCINLNGTNAEWFYHHFGLGDVVEVANSGGPALPVWDLYGDWSVPWSTWQAGNADS